MALPITFAGLTTAQMVYLDQNFQAVGILGTMPTTATGTNAITLTQNASTPTVSAYSNYMRFSFVAVATSSAAITINVGALLALPLFLPDGVTQAGSGDIRDTVYYEVAYVSSLNSGLGGFVLTGASSPGTTGANRITITYVPVFDLTVNGRVTAAFMTLNETNTYSFPAADDYRVININPVVSSAGRLMAYGFDIAQQGTGRGYGLFGRISARASGTAQAINVTSEGSGGSTATLAPIVASVQPVSGTNAAIIINAISLGSNSHDLVQGITFSAPGGQRWGSGIRWETGNEFGGALLSATYGSGSTIGVSIMRFTDLSSNVLFDVNRNGQAQFASSVTASAFIPTGAGLPPVGIYAPTPTVTGIVGGQKLTAIADTSGRMVVGAPTAISFQSNAPPLFQVIQNSSAPEFGTTRGIGIATFSSGAGAATLHGYRSRAMGIGGVQAVLSGNNIFTIFGEADDGGGGTIVGFTRWSIEGSSFGGRWTAAIRDDAGNLTPALIIAKNADVMVAAAALSAAATGGFLRVPSGNGPPTGTPVAGYPGAPLYVDSANPQLYFNVAGVWYQTASGSGGSGTVTAVVGTSGQVSAVTSVGTVTVSLPNNMTAPSLFTASTVNVTGTGLPVSGINRYDAQAGLGIVAGTRLVAIAHASGNMAVGAPVAVAFDSASPSLFQVTVSSSTPGFGGQRGLGVSSFSSGAGAATIYMYRSRAMGFDVPQAVLSGDPIATIFSVADDGANGVVTGRIRNIAESASIGGQWTFVTRAADGNLGTGLIVTMSQDVIVAGSALSAATTGGFLRLPGGLAAPTGTPNPSYVGTPIYANTGGSSLHYFNGGSWRTLAALDNSQRWNKTQRGVTTPVTQSAQLYTPSYASSNFHAVQLTSGVILGFPAVTVINDGEIATGMFVFTQSSSGNCQIALQSGYVWTSAVTLTTTANARNAISYATLNSSSILLTAVTISS